MFLIAVHPETVFFIPDIGIEGFKIAGYIVIPFIRSRQAMNKTDRRIGIAGHPGNRQIFIQKTLAPYQYNAVGVLPDSLQILAPILNMTIDGFQLQCIEPPW